MFKADKLDKFEISKKSPDTGRNEFLGFEKRGVFEGPGRELKIGQDDGIQADLMGSGCLYPQMLHNICYT